MARKKHTSVFAFAFADRLRICRERSGWQQIVQKHPAERSGLPLGD